MFSIKLCIIYFNNTYAGSSLSFLKSLSSSVPSTTSSFGSILFISTNFFQLKICDYSVTQFFKFQIFLSWQPDIRAFKLEYYVASMPFVDQYRKRKVSRASLPNDIKKGKILTFSDAGLNRTEIAREIGRSRNVVANFLRAPGKYGIKKRGKRQTKLGKRETEG
uniref:HTH_Tnp_Tc3_1 domain-containing protein n=1 Tax=Heterorhabditis bacteriophora TaxID=37862 RepID=A0A1I7WFP9_HETBA